MRLDRRMVEEGLTASRARAQALILAGSVAVDGQVVRKAAANVPGAISVGRDPCPWVSRAALKLLHALESFGLTPSGVALDLGASTGGFTEVLLARGADAVHAVDVGHGQMAPAIASDPRVYLHERINCREIPTGLVPKVDWITADISFISLEKALPSGLAHARPGATLVALIKPQFEAGREHIGKGGIVSNAEVQEAVCERIGAWLESMGWPQKGLVESPILGGDGNREFLITAALSQ